MLPIFPEMQSQRGAVLVFCLVLLTLLTLMAVAGMESLLLRERVEVNARMSRDGFEAAEAALRRGEETVWRVCPGAAPAVAPATHSLWPQSVGYARDWWEAHGVEAPFAGAAGSPPRYVLESWRAAKPPPSPPEAVYYRITARGTSAAGDSILQVVGVALCAGANLATRGRLSWRQLN